MMDTALGARRHRLEVRPGAWCDANHMYYIAAWYEYDNQDAPSASAYADTAQAAAERAWCVFGSMPTFFYPRPACPNK